MVDVRSWVKPTGSLQVMAKNEKRIGRGVRYWRESNQHHTGISRWYIDCTAWDSEMGDLHITSPPVEK